MEMAWPSLFDYMSIEMEKLSLRLERMLTEDNQRDPVDALADAKKLYEVLSAVRAVAKDPAARYVLVGRLKTALMFLDDVDKAADEAAFLLERNKQRLQETLPATPNHEKGGIAA